MITGPAAGTAHHGERLGEFEWAFARPSAVAPLGTQTESAGVRAREKLGGALLAGAAHELRNSVNSVLVSLETVLEDDVATLAPEHRRFLRVAQRNARRLVRLAEDVLGEEGGLRLDIGEVNAAALVAECAEGVQQTAAKCGVTLAIRCELVPMAAGDGGRLAQVIDNLLSNALKFTPPPGRVTIGVEARGGEVLVKVSDTGIGIGSQDLPHVFEPFYRRAGGGQGIPGSGLGLAVSKSIVEGHGGRIWVDSAPGLGSTFSFTIPALDDDRPGHSGAMPGHARKGNGSAAEGRRPGGRPPWAA
jgi:signal transduction histidine kinase